MRTVECRQWATVAVLTVTPSAGKVLGSHVDPTSVSLTATAANIRKHQESFSAVPCPSSGLCSASTAGSLAVKRSVVWPRRTEATGLGLP